MPIPLGATLDLGNPRKTELPTNQSTGERLGICLAHQRSSQHRATADQVPDTWPMRNAWKRESSEKTRRNQGKLVAAEKMTYGGWFSGSFNGQIWGSSNRRAPLISLMGLKPTQNTTQQKDKKHRSSSSTHSKTNRVLLLSVRSLIWVFYSTLYNSKPFKNHKCNAAY